MSGVSIEGDLPYVSPQALVEEGAHLSPGVLVWAFTHVRAGAILGESTSVGSHSYVDVDVEVGVWSGLHDPRGEVAVGPGIVRQPARNVDDQDGVS